MILLRKTAVVKNFNEQTLLSRINSLNKILQNNHGKVLSVTNQVLDELYQIIYFAAAQGNKAALLEACESLKLAYGLAAKESKARPDEHLYWREVILHVLAKENYQAVEYLVESSKNLFKLFPAEKYFIVETLSITVDISAQNKKLFIASAVFEILLPLSGRLTKEPKKTGVAVINTLNKIGVYALLEIESAFFQEIARKISKKLSKISEQNEEAWDRLINNWLRICLQNDLYGSFFNWRDVFHVYRSLRSGINKNFYADLINLAGQYVLRTDDRIVNCLLSDVLHYTWLKTSYLEAILCLQATLAVFKNTVSVIAWERAVFLFKPLFVFAGHLVNIKEQKNQRTALAWTLIDLILPELISSADIVTMKGNYQTSLQPIYYWREYFLSKAKSGSSQKRVKIFWQLVCDFWLKNSTYKKDYPKELLNSFHS